MPRLVGSKLGRIVCFFMWQKGNVDLSSNKTDIHSSSKNRSDMGTRRSASCHISLHILLPVLEYLLNYEAMINPRPWNRKCCKIDEAMLIVKCFDRRFCKMYDSVVSPRCFDRRYSKIWGNCKWEAFVYKILQNTLYNGTCEALDRRYCKI